MTDPKARENFLKFGNPDGKGSFAVGIALPNFLQKKEYYLSKRKTTSQLTQINNQQKMMNR